MPRPTSTKRVSVGRSPARATSNAQPANAAAKTASLETSWKMTAYPWYRSSAAAVASATRGPKTLAAADQATIDPA